MGEIDVNWLHAWIITTLQVIITAGYLRQLIGVRKTIRGGSCDN